MQYFFEELKVVIDDKEYLVDGMIEVASDMSAGFDIGEIVIEDFYIDTVYDDEHEYEPDASDVAKIVYAVTMEFNKPNSQMYNDALIAYDEYRKD